MFYSNKLADHIVKRITGIFFNRLKEYFGINFNEMGRFRGNKKPYSATNLPHRKDLCMACKNGCC
jgi:hypothetical protein